MTSGLQLSETEDDIVAIVDDDDAARDALEFLLTVLGRRPRAFDSASAFLDSRLTHCACLLLDQHMPVMNGLELATHLRSNNNTIPIMLISGNLTPEVRERAVHIGIDVICDKPPETEIIADFISQAIEKRAK
jgi:two-component system, LuxR family, response regulator FixJ